MNYIEFMNTYIKPHLIAGDKPFNRQLFNDTKDMLHKNGEINDKQVDRWIYPNNKYFQ